MESAQTTSLISIFSELEDPRIDRTKRHSLADMDSDWFETVEKGHGRVETRRCATVSSPEFIICSKHSLNKMRLPWGSPISGCS